MLSRMRDTPSRFSPGPVAGLDWPARADHVEEASARRREASARRAAEARVAELEALLRP